MLDKIFSEREDGKLTGFEWTLIISGVLIVAISVTSPTALLAGYRKLQIVGDLREWRVTTWLALLSSIAFVAYAVYVANQWFKDRFNDEDDVLCARWLLILLALVCVELWLWRYAAGTDFPRYAWFQLGEFFRQGKTTSAAIGMVLGTLAVIALNLGVFARWLVLVLNRAAR